MISDLLELPAVKNHGSGISSAELAEFHRVMSSLGGERFLGVGSKQYETLRGQKFEGMDQDELQREMLEELIDVQNYVTMLAIKVIAALKGEQ